MKNKKMTVTINNDIYYKFEKIINENLFDKSKVVEKLIEEFVINKINII